MFARFRLASTLNRDRVEINEAKLCPSNISNSVHKLSVSRGGAKYIYVLNVYIGFFRAGVYINVHTLMVPNGSKHHKT